MSTSTGLFGDSVTPFGVASYRQWVGDASNRFTGKAIRAWTLDRGLMAIMVNVNKSVVRKNGVSDSALLTIIRNANKSVVRKNVSSDSALLTIIRDFNGSMHRNGTAIYTVVNSRQNRLGSAILPLLDGMTVALNTGMLRAGIGQPIAGGEVETVQTEGQLWPRYY
ncbi:MAG: hypothetical protein ACXW1W_02720 [Methylococcaceae bacterium]